MEVVEIYNRAEEQRRIIGSSSSQLNLGLGGKNESDNYYSISVRVVAEDADTHTVNYTEAYESSAFKKFVTHCSSHVAETCSEIEAVQKEDGEKTGAYGLGLCLLDSMKSCLVEHGASLEETTPTNQKDSSEDTRLFKPPPINGYPVPLPPPIKFTTDTVKVIAKPPSLALIQPHPLSIETLKFQAVLRTCSHVSSRTCFTHPDVVTLSPCLVTSLNQCVYPDDTW
ncbi:nodulin-20-like [Vigna angularis]|uniref:nodulin-20-like n=1 Tax=Phaseolus angularis TaxID=3914 RepID=UPI0022B568F0|nr:nodulin-20-like [Vigna angularis]